MLLHLPHEGIMSPSDNMTLLENHLWCNKNFILIKSEIAELMSDNSSKVPLLCSSTGQTAGSSGQAVGGSSGNTTVTPCMGPQRPGAPSCLTSWAALCGVGEDQHHHPSGGAGYHRPADRGLRWRRGASESHLISPWSLFWLGNGILYG